jgi:uncharacterized protein with HEPN domain
MPRDLRTSLEDILEASRKIREYTARMDPEKAPEKG